MSKGRKPALWGGLCALVRLSDQSAAAAGIFSGLKQGLWEGLYSLLWLSDQLMEIAGPMSDEGAFLNNYSLHHGAIETSSQGRMFCTWRGSIIMSWWRLCWSGSDVNIFLLSPDDGSSFGKGALHGAILPIKYDGPWPPWGLLWKWWLLIERWWLELRYMAVFAGHGGWKCGWKNLKLEITPWAGNLEGKLTPRPWAYGWDLWSWSWLKASHPALGLSQFTSWVTEPPEPSLDHNKSNDGAGWSCGCFISPELESRVPPLGYWIWNVDAGLSKGSSIDHPNLEGAASFLPISVHPFVAIERMGASMDTLEGALLTYLNQAAVGLIVAEGAARTFPDLAILGSTYSAGGSKAPYMGKPRPPVALIRKGTGMDTPEGAA
ncbi:hypothetical protein V6N11_082107 [Hibiscus sabdariffa]|uniref:Uncharacterized protein n=1 Tax=Hibiscus sabdariffa TaxID=183260 RepID=A0ABR2QH84_9ROSI